MSDTTPRDKPHFERSSLPRKWKFLLTLSAILAAFTYAEKNATSLFEGFPQLRAAAHAAVFGPEPAHHWLQSAPAGVADRDTSDQTKAYKKSTELCLRPEHDNGTLVPGSAHFVATKRSSPDRATDEVTQDSAQAYCVTLTAATGAKEKLEIIEGHLIGEEQYPQN
jgi:hypothetical protein